MGLDRVSRDVVSGFLARVRCALVLGCWALQVAPALAQSSKPRKHPEAISIVAVEDETKPSEERPPPFRIGAYVETYYQWNFNRPSNGITNYRGFDNRHNTFTLSNVALDMQADYQDVIGRLTLQVGSAASTEYLDEPVRRGTSSVNATGPDLWKYLQQANVGYRVINGRSPTRELDAKHTFTVLAGLFLSPIGPESIVVHDNWNWSRSYLFFGCPYYHTGARGTYALSDDWSFTLAVYNGWNSVVDNNKEKSLSTQVTYARADLDATLLYFGGVERPQGAPEGRAWRNLFDAHVRWDVLPWLSLLAHGNAGFERNRFGASRWGAGAVSVRAQAARQFFVAWRGDMFYEHVPSNAAGRATPIFWPVKWVASSTITLDYQPHAHISIRGEYRHDHAAGDMFFGGAVGTAPGTETFVPNRPAQNTLTCGVTAWF